MQAALGNGQWTYGVAIVPPIASVFDATANDSDKSWTVPDDEMWKLNFAQVILTTSATVGNRQIIVAIADPDGNVLMDVAAGAVQAASTTRHYGFFQGIYRETSFTADEIEAPIPVDCFLPAGYTLTFKDGASIAATTDDMTVSFQYQKFNLG